MISSLLPLVQGLLDGLGGALVVVGVLLAGVDADLHDLGAHLTRDVGLLHHGVGEHGAPGKGGLALLLGVEVAVALLLLLLQLEVRLHHHVVGGGV